MNDEEGKAILILGFLVMFISAMISIVMIELIESGWISETYAIPAPGWTYRIPDYIQSGIRRIK